MKYKFIDIPHFISQESYEVTFHKLVELLKKQRAIVSIYRLGNVNHPGISDLDVIAVFEDGEKCLIDPRSYLDKQDKYIITHEVGGASESHFIESLKYVFWDNLKCIYGTNLLEKGAANNPLLTNRSAYKEQIGLEFLVKNFLDLTVQRKYGVIKLRSLLQEIKGIRYDIEFLDLQKTKLNGLIIEFLDRLDHWFNRGWDLNVLSKWLDVYYQELEKEINLLAESGKKLWVQEEDNLSYGRNVSLENGANYSIQCKGVFLPGNIIAQHKKLYNAHLRLNRFKIGVNFTTEDISGDNWERLEVIKKCKNYNETHLPHFGTLLSSLAYHFV